MKSLLLLSMSGLIFGSAVAATAQAPATTVAFDENGIGTLQQNTVPPTTLPFTALPLTYLLPFPVTPGDVLLTEPIGVNGGTSLSDDVRFTPNNSIEFFSDSSLPNDPPDNLADFAQFPSAGSFSQNAVTLPEIGPEGNNGASYTPTAGEPGFNPAGLLVTYHIVSDSPVPEAPSSVSLGLLLALGIGGFAVARKRKSA